MVERVENLVTIKGVVNGAFMPASKNRLLTDVVLQEGFHIRGGLYANNLTIEGPGTVEGPVLAKRDIIIYPPEQGGKRISLRCGLSARLAIATHVPDTVIESPVKTKGFLPFFVRGDVISESVSLENAVIIGNVFAKNAVIKDSIVVGSLLVEEKLVMRNSMAISFRAGSVELIHRNSLWVPYALVEGDITFAPYAIDQEQTNLEKALDREMKETLDREGEEKKATELKPAWLRYLGLCRAKGHGCEKSYWFHCPKHLRGTCEFEDVRMTEHDKVLLKQGGKPFTAITIAPRIIDLTKVQKELNELVDFLTQVLYFEHFHATAQGQIKANLDKEKADSDFKTLSAHSEFLEEVTKFIPIADRDTRK